MRFLRLFMTHPDLAVEFVISALIAVLVAHMVPGMVNSYYDKVEGQHPRLAGHGGGAQRELQPLLYPGSREDES